MRRGLLTMIGCTFITSIGARMTAVALPLLVLQQTGQVWATGLVGGAAGLPLLTVGWWGRGVRDRLNSGCALAAVMAVETLGLLIIPLLAACGIVDPLTLCASGLVIGTSGALLGPAGRSLISDIADSMDSQTGGSHSDFPPVPLVTSSVQVPGVRENAGTESQMGDQTPATPLVAVAPVSSPALATPLAPAVSPPTPARLHEATTKLASAGISTAPKWLALQDLAQRSSMIFVPPLAALLVVIWGALPLLWCEVVMIACAALAMLTVPSVSTFLCTDHKPASDHGIGSTVDLKTRVHNMNEVAKNPRATTMTQVLRTHPQIAAGIILEAMGGFTWFGFVLGLSVLGVDCGMPGALIGAGMGGYGVASVVVALVVPHMVSRVRPMPTLVISWSLLGLTFIALPMATPRLVLVALVSGVGGLAMPWGIAALNMLISGQTHGAERRMAFTAFSVACDGGTSLGLLVGGALIGLLGSGTVLVVTGMLQVLTAAGVAVVLAFRGRIRR